MQPSTISEKKEAKDMAAMTFFFFLFGTYIRDIMCAHIWL